MKTSVSPEGIKVLGGLLAQAGDVGAARRVAGEVHAALCEIDGLTTAADSAPAVVVDVLGDVDWQGTATVAGWVSAQTYREACADLAAHRESTDAANSEISELRATVAELQAELDARQTPIAVMADSPASVHVETVKPQAQRTRCPHCEKIVAKNAPRIERDGDTWHAECWAELSTLTETGPAQPDLPVETEADAPTFEPAVQAGLGFVDRALQGVDMAEGESQSVTLACEVTAEGLKVVDFFETEAAPEVPADPWPQFAHLSPTMREWAIKRELAKRS